MTVFPDFLSADEFRYANFSFYSPGVAWVVWLYILFFGRELLAGSSSKVGCCFSHCNSPHVLFLPRSFLNLVVVSVPFDAGLEGCSRYCSCGEHCPSIRDDTHIVASSAAASLLFAVLRCHCLVRGDSTHVQQQNSSQQSSIRFISDCLTGAHSIFYNASQRNKTPHIIIIIAESETLKA